VKSFLWIKSACTGARMRTARSASRCDKIQFAVVHQQMQFDFGIFLGEFLEARQQPIGADAVAGVIFSGPRAIHGYS